MKRNFGIQLLHSFVLVFGALQLLFMLADLLYYGAANILWTQTAAALIAALVFSLTHCIVTADRLDGHFAVRTRVLWCGLPCAIAGGILAKELGFQQLLPHVENTAAASVLWLCSFLLSAAVYAAVFLLMERHCRSQKAKYDAALERYKKQSQ